MIKPPDTFLRKLWENYLESDDPSEVALPRDDKTLEPHYVEWLEANGYAVKGIPRLGGTFINLTPDGIAYLKDMVETQ